MTKIINKLKIITTQERIKEIKDSLKSTQEATILTTNDDGVIVKAEKEDITFNMDFNNITPMPKWVRTDSASFDKYEKYGKENYWFHWNLNNWGTHQNAEPSNIKDKEDTIFFETTCSAVADLMRKLSLIFLDVEFEYSYSSECFGNSTGFYKFKNGFIVHKELPNDYSTESYKLSEEIFNKTLDEYMVECE